MFTLQQLLNAGLPAISTDGNDARANTEFSRGLTDAEWITYQNIANPDEGAYLTNRAQLKAEYQSTIDQLQSIENAVSPTNAQVIAAVKFLAKTIRLILKLFVRLYQ